MAFSIGAAARAYVNGVDLSPYLAGSDMDVQQDAAEVTTYANTSKVYIYGLQNQNLAVNGYFDGSAGAIEQTLTNLIGTAGTMWTVYPAGDTAGNRGQGLVGIETDYKTTAQVSSAVSVTATTLGTVGAEGLVILASKQTQGTSAAGTITLTGVDFGTNLSGGTISTGGLSSYLQVFSGSGAGTVTVSVQSSAVLGSGYSTLVSHTAFAASTAPKWERVTVAAGGTINEFLRTQIVYAAAGTITLNHAVCRRS